MNVKYKDYYQSLGVLRNASADQIKRAYRKLAQQYHPDRNNSADAATRFSEISEAYEVLSDPQKRPRYDQLGANWKAGQDFRPPPGYETVTFGSRGPGGFDAGNVGNFFEMIFGQEQGRPRAGFEELFASTHRPKGTGHRPPQEAILPITLEESHHGATQSVTLQVPDGAGKTLEVKIPRGITDGKVIRLKNQGANGTDMLLRVQLAPHPQYRSQGHDLHTDLAIAPWEAALGATVDIATLDGMVALTIPTGTSSGRRLRLAERGLAGQGDLLVTIQVAVPTDLGRNDRVLYEQLRNESSFDPRRKKG